MMKKGFTVLLMLAVVLSAMVVPTAEEAQAAGITYYVDGASGHDTSGDGSSGSPWKTIGKAASAAQAGDTVKIRSGTYRETVTPVNSGTAGNYIAFEADTGADVTISGADLVTGSWSVHTGNTYKTTAALSMGDWKNQVFVDGVAMNLARWPNAGTDLMHPVYKEADSGTDNTKIVDSELTQPSGYWNGAAVVVLDKTQWGIASAIVSSYTTGQLNLGTIHTYDLGEKNGYGSPYYLIGKLAALDGTSEWYYDSGTTTVYLQTPNGDSPAVYDVEVKARNLAFNLDNKDYIRIKGVKLFASTLDTRNSEHIVLDGLEVSYPTHYELSHTGSEHNWKTSGIQLGGTDNVLKNSTVAYSPGNLVTLSGEANQVVNNVLHDAAYGPFYTTEVSNINVRGTGHLISHNTLYNSGRAVISGSPENARIQYNHGYDAMQLTDDGGFIYFGYTDGDATEIHHNVFHGTRTFAPPSNILGGIYFDHGTSNFKVYNNVVSDTPKFGVFVHLYNEFIEVYNNTFHDVSITRMKTDGALDAYGVRYINNISYDDLQVATGFGIVERSNFKSGDPLFVNAASDDFRLQSSSTAVDAGEAISGITNSYEGSAPDIGAYEHGGANWSAGHNFTSPPNPSFTTTDTRYQVLLQNGFFERERDTVGHWSKTHAQSAVIQRSGDDTSASRYKWTHGLRLGTGADGVEQTVTGLTPNTEYEIRGFGKAASSGQTIRIGVKNYGGSDTYEEITSTSWAKESFTFTTGATHTSATVYVYKPTTGGYAYADDVTLVEVEAESVAGTLFSDDFEDGNATGWTAVNGSWSVVSDGSYLYKQSTGVSEAIAYAGDASWSDYSVQADVKLYNLVTGAGSGILARYADSNNFYMFRLYASGKVQLYKRVSGTFTLLDEATQTVTSGATYTLKLTVNGSTIKGYVDGGEKISVTDASLSSGKIGFRSYNQPIGVDNVEVTALAPAFSDDFEDGNATGWTAVNGSWSVVTDGSQMYKQSTGVGEAIAYAGDASWSDYSVQADVKLYNLVTGAGSGILARYADSNNFYMFRLFASGKVQLYKRVSGTFTLLDETTQTVTSGATYTLKLTVNGSTIKGYVDGVEKISVTDASLSSGKIGFRSYHQPIGVDNVEVME